MSWVRLGRAFRAVRIRRGLRQQDVAQRARVHRSAVSLIERGQLDRLALGTLTRVADVLEIRLDLSVGWRGGDLDRMLRAGHSQLHETLARLFEGLPDWLHAPEVSFAVYGERGVIDILCFHPPTGCLLVIEIKTEIVDAQELIGKLDVKTRLARRIAAERGWSASSVSAWVVVLDTRSNRRRLALHRALLRSAFPDDGRTMRAWLRRPAGSIRALGFMPIAAVGSRSRLITGRKRVRLPVS